MLEHRATLLALLLLGAGIRWLQLSSGLWLDEIWSMRTSDPDQSVASIIAACQADTHPPLFDLMLFGWLSVFGESDWSGRMLGFFWGVVGLYATWYYALRLSASRIVACFALGLLAFNYFHIYYSNEVRFYSFLYVASLVACAHLVFYLRTGATKHWLVLVGTGWVLLYTHYFGAFLLAALGIGLLVLVAIGEVDRRRFWWVVGAGVMILLGFVPWLPYIPGGGTGAGWIAPPAPFDFFAYLYNYTGKNPVSLAVFAVGIGGAVSTLRRFPKFMVVLLSAVVFGYLLPLLVSYLITPLLHERYTIIYLPALVLMAAFGLAEAGRWRLSTRAIVLPVLWSAIAVNFLFIHGYFKRANKEPWRPVAEAVAENPIPVYSDVGFWTDYYLAHYGLPTSKPLSTEQPVNGSYWLLKTPYDAKNWTLAPLSVKDTVPFEGGFVLYRLEADAAQ